MNYLNRAWLSVTRRKGKSLLLFTILFILGNVIAGAVSIQQATQNVERKIKHQMGATATLQLDYERLSKEEPQEALPNLSKELIEEIGKLPYVKYYDYVLNNTIGSESFQAYVPPFLEENGGVPAVENNQFAFNLRGVQSSVVLPIEEGEISIVQGRNFTNEEVTAGKTVALISKELADKNNAAVGDTITLINYIYGEMSSDGQAEIATQFEHQVEIIGIYQSKKQTTSSTDNQKEGDQWSKAFQEQMLANRIFVPNKFVEATRRESIEASASQNENGLTEEEMQGYISAGEPLYVLKSPEDVENFRQEAQPLLPDYYIVYAASDAYDTIAAPVQSMSRLAGYVLIVAVIATITIITLVVLLFLRDRKHELGIYLALGEAKWKVVGQTLIEVFLIAFLSLSLSIFTGNATAGAVSDSLIQHQIEQNEDPNGGISYTSFEFQPDTSTDDVINEYKVELSLGYIAVMYGIGLGTVLLATLVPVGYIVRLNPKRIMM